jgi:hypothetical protein
MAVSSFWAYRRIAVFMLSLLLLFPPGLVAEGNGENIAQVSIPDGTPVQLRLAKTVSSATAKAGDPVDFVVENDVNIGGLTVVPEGSLAKGSVLSIKRRGIFGIGGRLVYEVNTISLSSTERIAAHARTITRGRSHVGLMLAGMAVTGLLFLPAAPLFLLTRGTQAVALKDTEITARIECDSHLPAAELHPADADRTQLNHMLENLPPRVTDRFGRGGDMVNLVFVAQQNDLEAAFTGNGWVTTDPWKPVALWHMLKYRSHDAHMPMAEFYMFGRRQDYSYALPDPQSIIRRRHHIRIWKTHYTLDGVPLWAGAATYDATLEYAKAGHLVNHIIDPNVDAERDFIGNDIAANDAQRQYIQSKNPVTEADTTSGHPYWSDSRLLLVDLHQNPAILGSAPAARGVQDRSRDSVVRSGGQ